MISPDRRTEEHIGVSGLRGLSAKRLRSLDHTVVVHDGPHPVRALVPYATYLQWQAALAALQPGTRP